MRRSGTSLTSLKLSRLKAPSEQSEHAVRFGERSPLKVKNGMKKLLTIVAIAAFSLMLCTVSFAQDAGPQGGRLTGKPHPRRAGVRLMEKFQKDVLASLNLTADQRKKIDDLNTDLASKIKTIIEQNKGTTGNKNVGAQRRQVVMDYNNNLHDILGDDLWRQYREGMLAKMKEAREQRNARLQAQNGQQEHKDEMDGGSTGGKG